ncbi:type IV secretion system DNA-binding domain-containing protein [Paracoccus sp. FO-3]|uniref:type IV secretion system DNA-binding domain-containing protein n=1 Tax=Paracoccus sp. FO-3 TaxID=1335059 RepID=UPI0021080E56|nr:type IV secretion system DNA-binding domain-containing protein [Paracoccus sp. FO-3]
MKRNMHPTRFVRGGQTTQHWWRMALQVLRTALFSGVGAFTLSYCVLIATHYELRYMRETLVTWLAGYNMATGNPDRLLSYIDHLDRRQERRAREIAADTRMNEVARQYKENAGRLAWLAAIPAGAALVISIGIFAWAGRRLGENRHVRGSRLISQAQLADWSRRKWQAWRKKFGSESKAAAYTIAGIPFPPNAVEAQTGIFGTVGVGKTNAIKELLKTIRATNGRAIVYDRMGSLLRDFHDPETDVIINPFDARSVVWSPFFEARTPEALAQIAEVMIPQRPWQSDPFWSQTARLVFEYAARSLLKAGTPTNADLRQAIMSIPADDLAKLLAGTPGSHFFGPHVEKTSASIRANMIAELRFLEFLRDDGAPFSVRDWVTSDRPGFLFLTGDAEHSAATRNVISTAVEVAANALMTCEERREPSLWFFLDEVPTLNRLPFLVAKLAEVRQFGGAFVLGYQVYAQLEDIYGEKGAQSIAGTLNNRIVFNTPDARTAKLFSDSLGFEDLIEQRENLSFGAHESRDGVAFMSQRTERPIVTPSEIQALPQFEAYIRFAYDAPTAKVLFEPVAVEPRVEKFIPYRGDGFDLDGMNPDRAPAPPTGPGAPPTTMTQAASDTAGAVQMEPPAAWADWSLARQRTAFEDWLEAGRREGFDTRTGKMEAPLPDLPVEVLWDHYCCQRLAGHEQPGYRIAPDTGSLVSGRERAAVKNPDRITIPTYSEAVAASLDAEQTGRAARLPKADDNADPLFEAMDDRGSLL